MIFSYWNERMRWRNITRYHWLYLLSQILYMSASECPYCWDNINVYRSCRGWYGIEQMVVSVSCSSWSAAELLHPDTLYNHAHLLCLDNAAILAVKLPRIACFGAISPSILNRFPSNFAKAIFYSNPDSPENFVKLYSVFQKLDHLTCSKLKLRRPSITPLN